MGSDPQLPKATCVACSAGYRDKVDEGHSIVADAPHSHETDGVHEDHDDGEQVEDA